jgi:hypothetical protein
MDRLGHCLGDCVGDPVLAANDCRVKAVACRQRLNACVELEGRKLAMLKGLFAGSHIDFDHVCQWSTFAVNGLITSVGEAAGCARSGGKGNMSLASRVKGIILRPDEEWKIIEAESPTVLEFYLKYLVFLAAIPPFANFLGAWLFGVSHGRGVVHPAFASGMARAVTQYALLMPAVYMAAFVISMIAPHFDGKSDDLNALRLVAYSYTPAFLASGFGIVPGMRWLDVLGFYGVYIFYLGMPRMLKCPKDNADVLTMIALFLAVGVSVLHARVVDFIAPMALM